MKILCSVGLRSGPELVARIAEILGTGHELLLAHVIDTEPRRELMGFLRGPSPEGPRVRKPLLGELEAAERKSGETILAEASEAALQAGFSYTTSLLQGEPGRKLVELAQQIQPKVVTLFPREDSEVGPTSGPASIGHTARFIIDHAPCAVLLLRK
jgi:nucleotide-binding universal stress UspA family protein